MSENWVVKNGSGCTDLTVDSMIKKEIERKKKAKEDYKYYQMRNKVKDMIEKSGYVLDGPICLINTKTGNKRRIY